MEKLVFSVQKHDASRLHYDFRLEMPGEEGNILKSWAVPKGPSMDPSEKRLAVLVDDHDMFYHDFEGKIEEGYGKGSVMLWDHGHYQPIKKRKDDIEKISVEDFKDWFGKGNIEFVLKGKKLKGKFALVRFTKKKKNWLLIKMRDEHATDKDILKEDKSVKSGKKIDQI